MSTQEERANENARTIRILDPEPLCMGAPVASPGSSPAHWDSTLMLEAKIPDGDKVPGGGTGFSA